VTDPDRQRFRLEDIVEAAGDAVPQMGGEDGETRILGFPACDIGFGANLQVHETWYEGAEGEDAECLLHFIENTRENLGNGNIHHRQFQVGLHKSVIPREVFEEVWERSGGPEKHPCA
jgi:hypothetical protein